LKKRLTWRPIIETISLVNDLPDRIPFLLPECKNADLKRFSDKVNASTVATTTASVASIDALT
jgi:hypothetical protein